MQSPKNSRIKCIYTLGPEGSFHHLSLLKMLNGEKINIKLAADFPAIFTNVKDECYGWIAVENSKAGAVAYNAIKIQAHYVKVGELSFNILLALASKSEKPFTHILTHPKAWEEAEQEIIKKYPQVTFIPTNSTAEAARLVAAATKDYAAICHPETAINYGLSIVIKEIVSQNTNTTKFILFKK